MSTENTPSHPSTAAPQPVLTPAEKLALSRQALHAALYPPPKPKKPTVISSLRKLWPVGRKAKQTAASVPTTVAAALVPQQTESFNVGVAEAEKGAVISAPRARQEARGGVGQAVANVFDKVGSLLGAVLHSRWRKHPAHFALQVGEPLLQSEIRKRPLPWLAAAAAAGAAVVLLHPWRWKQSRRLAGSILGKEMRVLAGSGLVFAASSVLSEVLRRVAADDKK